MENIYVLACMLGAVLFSTGVVYRKHLPHPVIWLGGGALLYITGLLVPSCVRADPGFWINPHMICGQSCIERLEGGLSSGLGERIGLYGFVQNISGRGMKPFQQTYGGLSLDIGGGFEIGGGLGADNASNIIKNGWIAYNNDAISLFATAERGGLPYNRLIATYRLGDFRLGTRYDTPFGWGGFTELELNKKIRRWAGIFTHNIALGIQIDF